MDAQLLRMLAAGSSVAGAGDLLALPVSVLAQRLRSVRALYGVTSTAAALRCAAEARHL